MNDKIDIIDKKTLEARRPRNNVARLPFDPRRRVCELLFDGATYDEIRDSVKSEFNVAASLHNSSILAYSKSAEYVKYCSDRRDWEKKTLPKRWAAEHINGGKGIESAADLAAMELLEQIQQLSGTGLEVSDAQKLAAAVVSLKRTATGSKEKILKDDFEKKETALKAKIEELEKEIDKLRNDRSKSSGGLSEEALKKIREQARIM